MKYLITIIIAFILTIGVSFAENFPYKDKSSINIHISKDEIDIDDDYIKMDYNSTEMKDILTPGDSAGEKIRDKYIPSIKDQRYPISYYISTVINYFLGLLAFFTFIVILTGVSMTFFGKSDEGIKKGKKYIQIGTIVIIVIGISWLISMFIFNIYSSGINSFNKTFKK